MIKCPVCFSKNFSELKTYTAEGYINYICDQCQVIFANPMKAASKEWYEKHEYYSKRDIPKDNKPWYEKSFLENNLNNGKGKVLNIGCGYNRFLLKVKNMGYDLSAVDLNENTVKFTRETLGIEKTFNMLVEDFIAENKDARFDIITFFELLEHIEEPGVFLRELKKILKDNGRIVFSVPNRNRFLPHTHWADYPPHHLTRWNKKAIEKNLKKCGFLVEKSIISPVSAEQLMYAIGIYFGTLFLESKVKDKKELHPLKILYRFLYRFRVIFYNLLAMPVRIILKNKGTFIYTVAKLKES